MVGRHGGIDEVVDFAEGVGGQDVDGPQGLGEDVAVCGGVGAQGVGVQGAEVEDEEDEAVLAAVVGDGEFV